MNISKIAAPAAAENSPSVVFPRTMIGSALTIIAMGIILIYPNHFLPIRLGAFLVLVGGVVLIVGQYRRLYGSYLQNSRKISGK